MVRLGYAWLAAFLCAAAMLGLIFFPLLAFGRDVGQWKYASPDLAAYFASLKQPDNPVVSCCGEADAYWADETERGPDGGIIAVITDTRDDAPLHRPHLAVGTKIPVPSNKIRKPPIPNPTDHTLIFIGSGYVFCYEPTARY